jgi:hypothetical protein
MPPARAVCDPDDVPDCAHAGAGSFADPAGVRGAGEPATESLAESLSGAAAVVFVAGFGGHLHATRTRRAASALFTPQTLPDQR